jgi:hypothetical protein
MNTLEERVTNLEKELQSLKSQPRLSPPVPKDWRSTVGWANDEELHYAAEKAGAEYRRSQTYEKEIEARGGAGY